MYSYNVLQLMTYPEPQELLRIIQLAEQTDPNMKDDRPVIAVGDRARKVNARLAGFIRKRKTAIQSFGWDLLNEDGADSPDKQYLVSAINYMIRNFWELPAYGKIGFNVSWLFNEPVRTWIPKQVLLADKFNYKATDQGFFAYSDGTKAPAIKLSDRFLGAKSDSYLTEILFTEMFRFDAVRENANFIKKLKGLLQIINKGGSDEEQQAALEAAEGMVKTNVVVTSDSIGFDLKNVAGAGESAFKAVIETAQADESIAVLGQADVAKLPSGSGSRAALAVQMQVSADIHYSDMNDCEDLVNQLVYWFDMKNYGRSKNTFKINVVEEVDGEKQAVRMNYVLKTGLPFLKTEVYNMVDMTPPLGTEKAEEIVQLAPSL